MMNFVEGAVLLVDKPSGWTSFDVVNKIRYSLNRKFKQKIKVGHAGTLDPLATGLLIICTGKATKRLEAYQGFDKTYTGVVLLGKTTSSYDLETPFLTDAPVSEITEKQLHEASAKFIGKQLQKPPVFSAIKVGGKVAYHEARLGNEIVLQSREVKINSFRITEVNLPEVSFEVECSKGTYIRSLAHDFGQEVGCGCCLAKLVRTRVGDWSLENASSLDEILKLIETV